MNEAPLNIPAIRKALHLTQSQLADMAGVNLSTVWRWENEGIPKRGPARALLDRLCLEASNLNVSPASSSAGAEAGASVTPPAQKDAPVINSLSPEVLPSGEAVARCEVRQRATATNSVEAVR
ncbi:helix-turn-helix domain-containing protein [Brucella pituitosa]